MPDYITDHYNNRVPSNTRVAFIIGFFLVYGDINIIDLSSEFYDDILYMLYNGYLKKDIQGHITLTHSSKVLMLTELEYQCKHI